MPVVRTPRDVADASGIFKVITGVVVALATVLLISEPDVPMVKASTLVTVPPPVYCGTLIVLPTKVAAPEVPVVVNVIAPCLELNVVQSAEDKYPFALPVAAGIEIVFEDLDNGLEKVKALSLAFQDPELAI